MTEVNMRQSNINGIATSRSVSDNDDINQEEPRDGKTTRSECEFQSNLVILETPSSDERSDESFHNESTCESDIIAFGNALPVSLIKSEGKLAGNAAMAIKLPLGRYEIAKVPKPQINLKATNATGSNPLNFINGAKPRTTPAREAVDPAKYYIINDEPDGTKYACSKCGNVYKWRKSLNKHWKEKHDGEAPPSPAERERLFKCPPQSFQKHSTLHVMSTINNVGSKNILFPSAPVSLANLKPSSQIRIPASMYTLVNINKTETASSQTHVNHSQTSPNMIWKPQVFKNDDFAEVSPAHQTSKQFEFNRSSKQLYENLGVLDLSVKGSMDQEKPLDFSVKSVHTKLNEGGQDANNFSKKPGELASNDSVYSCFTCGLKFNQLLELNGHFAHQHMNSLYQMADDNISTLNSKDHHVFQIQRFSNKNSDIICCVICGHPERWELQMVKHFESEHYGIEPNPYKTSNLNYSDVKVTTPSPPQSPAESNGLNNHSLNAAMLKKFGFPDNGVLDLESQGTAIVIPKAPEETALHSGNLSLKSQEGTAFSDEGSAFVPDGSEELSSTETIKVTFIGKSGRGKKESSFYNGDVVLPYECQLCGYRARWPSEMTQHMKNHSDEKPYQCPQCTYRSKWKWDVVKHLKRCGGNKDQADLSQKRKRTFPKAFPEVSSCDTNEIKVTHSDTSLKETSSRCPPNVMSTANDKTKKRCYEGSPLGTLEAESTSASSNSSDHHSNLHPCDQCYFVGHSPAELKRHLRVHSDEKPYSCNTCNYSSKWKCDLKKHLRTYNHIPATPMEQPASTKSSDVQEAPDITRASFEEKIVLGDEVFQEGRMKCKDCAYEATNMIAFFDHVKNHNDKDYPQIYRKHFGHENQILECIESDPNESKIKLMSSLGLHQITLDTCSISESKVPHLDKQPIESSQDFSVEEKLKMHDKEPNSSKLSVEDEQTNLSFEGNPILNYSRSVFNSFNNNSVFQEGSSSECKESHKLFTIQDVVINEVRLKLIVKSGKHFYGCIKCSYVSLSSFRAVYHSKQHGSRKNFKCSFCDYSSSQLTFIHKHTALSHGEVNNNNLRKSNDSRLRKVDHFMMLYRMNLSLRNNVCINCGYTSLNKTVIMKHRLTRPCSQLLIKHSLLLRAGEVFSCDRCSFKTDERTALVTHSKGHRSLFQHKCLDCDFSSNLRNVIMIHRKNQHGSRKC